MRTTFRFMNFQVYKDAKRLATRIFRMTRVFPLEMRSQLTRSSQSIVLNIAEGSAKESDKDFNRYIQNSLGSVNETVAGLELAKDFGLLKEKDLIMLMKEAESIARQLGGLSKKLKMVKS